ncbi:MAG: hypothetical protein LBV79_02110 [Candidatus Adiutrix sp.]|jgi:hypothetical protein|nr:hypothetical protein [Candidatus Adiutrix sp.]
MKNDFMTKTLPYLTGVLKNGVSAWVFVVKLTLPALFLTRLLLVFDLLDGIATFFEPAMALFDLPSEMALVWVAYMAANSYVGISVFLTLLPTMDPLTLSQATTLGCMYLLAHSLIIEGQVCRGAGMSFVRVSLFRVIAAVILGLIVSRTAALTGWGTEPATVMLSRLAFGDPVPPWGVWAWGIVTQMFLVLILMEALLFMMEFIKYFGLTRLIGKVLGPPLRLAGVGESALMVTIIGCVVGLGYGGGLIVAESRSGNLPPGDIFGAMTLMAIFQSLVEDSLLAWAMGVSLWWLLGIRLIFVLLLAGVVNRLARRPRWHTVLVGKKLNF